jgi:3'-phosphoadenosine 5'-phosphosulfate sulfotransferase (PAPS reductase)/FAD synthetase
MMEPIVIPDLNADLNDPTKVLKVCSVSGGKDSTALYLWMLDIWGREGFRAVFADTGNEHPVTLNYVRNLPEMTGGPEIAWVRADFVDRLKKRETDDPTTNAYKVFEKNRAELGAKGHTSGNPFLDMMIWKGRAPSPKAQFCTEYLKMQPIKLWLESVRGDHEVVMFTGIRAGESAKRAKYPPQEFLTFFDCYTVRPLLTWTEEDVFSLLKSKGIPPNPLYEAGMSRVGCFPCIHARKTELARLPDWAWDKLLEWEDRIGRSWFAPNTAPNKGSRFGPTVPDVSQVREWSKTKWGGKEVDPNAPDAADVPSCMATWGQCE